MARISARNPLFERQLPSFQFLGIGSVLHFSRLCSFPLGVKTCYRHPPLCYHPRATRAGRRSFSVLKTLLHGVGGRRLCPRARASCPVTRTRAAARDFRQSIRVPRSETRVLAAKIRSSTDRRAFAVPNRIDSDWSVRLAALGLWLRGSTPIGGQVESTGESS